MQGRLGARRAVMAVAAIATSIGFGVAPASAQDSNGNGNGNRPADRNSRSTPPTPPTIASAASPRPSRSRRCRAASMSVWPNFYAGIWASSVDFGDVQDASGFHNSADIEMIGYAASSATSGAPRSSWARMYYFYPGSYGILNVAKDSVKRPRLLRGHARLQARDPSWPDAHLHHLLLAGVSGRRRARTGCSRPASRASSAPAMASRRRSAP